MLTTATKPGADVTAQQMMRDQKQDLAMAMPNANEPKLREQKAGAQLDLPQVANPQAAGASDSPTESSAEGSVIEIERDFTSAEAEIEVIADQVAQLWKEHKGKAHSVKMTQGELRDMRVQLGRHLHTLKALHVKVGRGGQWSARLREHGISRTTADRYAKAHETSLRFPPDDLPAGGPVPPTSGAISALVIKHGNRLRRILVTQEAVSEFLSGLQIFLQSKG